MKQKRVLLIDNGRGYVDQLEQQVKEQAKKLGQKIEIDRVSAENLKKLYDKNDVKTIQGYDTIVSSGSSKGRKYDQKTHAWVAENARKDTGILGVCYGAQHFAQAYGATIKNSGKMHHGHREAKVTGKHGILKGVHEDGKIRSYGHHQRYIPKGEHGDLEVLAETKSEHTGEKFVEAYKVKGKNVYGVQFHPEKSNPEKSTNVQKVIYNLLAQTIKK